MKQVKVINNGLDAVKMFNEGYRKGIERAIEICNDEIKNNKINLEKIGVLKIKQKLLQEIK